jgi:predicted negative regulator of RcsB-dependent stress response
MPGCSGSGSKAGSGSGSGGAALNYQQAYAQGQYARAYDEASRVASNKRSKDRDQAALIAGLSARSLDRISDAERWLRPLLTNADPTIQGRAAAAMGLMASDAGRHEEAARLLDQASRKLRGDDAARAAMYAGDSQWTLNRSADARASWTRARELVVQDGALRAIINDRLSGQAPQPLKPGPITGAPRPGAGRFTIQAGAYQSIRDAQARANQLSNFGATRVVERFDRTGKRLFAVRVGQFPSADAARQVARQIGSGAFVATIDDER